MMSHPVLVTASGTEDREKRAAGRTEERLRLVTDPRVAREPGWVAAAVAAGADVAGAGAAACGAALPPALSGLATVAAEDSVPAAPSDMPDKRRRGSQPAEFLRRHGPPWLGARSHANNWRPPTHRKFDRFRIGKAYGLRSGLLRVLSPSTPASTLVVCSSRVTLDRTVAAV